MAEQGQSWSLPCGGVAEAVRGDRGIALSGLSAMRCWSRMEPRGDEVGQFGCTIVVPVCKSWIYRGIMKAGNLDDAR